MYITEMFDQTPDGYRSEKDDNSVLRLKDMRKTRLSLAHLNKMRQAHDVRTFEMQKKATDVKKQYAAPAEEQAGGGLGSL
jgi:hypothetical protein